MGSLNLSIVGEGMSEKSRARLLYEHVEAPEAKEDKTVYIIHYFTQSHIARLKEWRKNLFGA